MSSIRCICWRCENGLPPDSSHLPDISTETADQSAHIDAEVMLAQDDAIYALLTLGAPLNRRRNALLPAVNLAPEILAMIFEFACYPKGDSQHEDYYAVIGGDFWQSSGQRDSDTTVGPLYISRVCSTWRHVAFGATQLWNNVRLTVDRSNARKQAELLQYWLSKSGQQHLTVGLMEKQLFDDVYRLYDMPTDVIDVLLPYAHRLRTAELLMTAEWEPALIHIGECAARLTSLTLGRPREYRPIVHVPFFASSLQLRNVKLIGYKVMDVSLPSAQIERLSTDNIQNFGLAEVLSPYPNLQHCTLDTLLHGPPAIPAPITPHTYPTLRSLELHIRFGMYIAPRLKDQTFPALHSLKVQLYHNGLSISTITTFLTRSACTDLETLNLFGPDMPEDDLIDCLQVTPRVRFLALKRDPRDDGLSQRFLNLMNPKRHSPEGQGRPEKDSSQCLVPNLETFYYWGDVSFKPRALLQFLADRWYGRHVEQPVDEQRAFNMPVGKLRSATIKIPRLRLKKDEISVLRKLRQKGMHLEIQDGAMPRVGSRLSMCA